MIQGTLFILYLGVFLSSGVKQQVKVPSYCFHKKNNVIPWMKQISQKRMTLDMIKKLCLGSSYYHGKGTKPWLQSSLTGGAHLLCHLISLSWVCFPPCSTLPLTFSSLSLRRELTHIWPVLSVLLCELQNGVKGSFFLLHRPLFLHLIPCESPWAKQVERWTFLGQCALKECVSVWSWKWS